MYFLLISIGTVALIYGYSGWRMITPLPISATATAFSWGGVGLCAALPHFTFWARNRLDCENAWGDRLAWVTYCSLALFVLAFWLLLLRDFAWLAWRLIALAGIPLPGLPAPNILNAATLGLALLLSALGFYRARGPHRTAQIKVPIPGLHPDLQGYRIAHFSDLHIGPTLKRPFVESIVRHINALNPDLIAFTGDLADGSVRRLAAEVEPLRGLKARDGSFFVTGNHEYYSGAEHWVRHAADLGFEVLLNRHQLIHHGAAGLLVAGVCDPSAAEYPGGHVSDPAAALEGAGPHHCRLLLAHQPRSVEAAAAVGFDLQLSGHTHGGQFVPWKYVVPLQQPFLAGLHRLGRTWLYVSRGAGYWGPPLRLGAPPDVSLVTLEEG